MIDFDYVALNALAAVVREGSFEGAARTLNVTQSAVSQRIKQLEERVGAILIVRGRPCVPTDFGLQLCRHVDHVLLLEHEIKKDMEADAGGTTKRLYFASWLIMIVWQLGSLTSSAAPRKK